MKKPIGLILVAASVVMLMLACTKKPDQPPTLVAPDVTTEDADQVTESSARLKGRINPRGTKVFGYFEYGRTHAYGNRTQETYIGSDNSATAISHTVGSLDTDATYYYRLVAFNAEHTVEGTEKNFRTGSGQPVISLDSSNISFEAVQNGSLPSAKSFKIANTGSGTLNWSVSVNRTWLTVGPTSGTNSGTVTVTVTRTDLSPGQYNATITVTDSKAVNSPQTVAVTYTVRSPAPHITLDSSSLSFAAIQNEAVPSGKSFKITNTGGGTLSWSVADDAAWLNVNPVMGTSNSTTITVTITSTDLSPDTYHATITVSSTNANNSPQTVAVEYTVRPPAPHITLDSAGLSFAAIQNAATPSAKSFKITNIGGGTLNWSVDDDATWLSVNPTSGNSNSATIIVAITSTSLNPDTYDAIITVSSINADNSPQTVAVTYKVSAVIPSHIGLDSASLSFAAEMNGTLPGSKSFRITNGGGGLLNWSVADDADWLDVNPAGGNSNSAVITVEVTATNLFPGIYEPTITVSSTNADNSPQTISVTYTVTAPPGHLVGGYWIGNCETEQIGNWPAQYLDIDTSFVVMEADNLDQQPPCHLAIQSPGFIEFTFNLSAMADIDSLMLWFQARGEISGTESFANIGVLVNDQPFNTCVFLAPEWIIYFITGDQLAGYLVSGENKFSIWNLCCGGIPCTDAWINFVEIEAWGTTAAARSVEPLEGLPPDLRRSRVLPVVPLKK